MKGELSLIQAAERIFSELTSFPQEFDSREGLAQEREIVENVKRATLLVAGLAAQKHREELAEQQEILLSLADMTMEVYAMESSLLRGLKIAAKHPPSAPLHEKVIRCYVNDSADKVYLAGQKVLVVVSEGDDQRTYQAALRRFCKHGLAPTIWMRRDITAALLDASGYRALVSS